jgi:flagellin
MCGKWQSQEEKNMGIVIRTNATALRTLRSLNKTSRSLNENMVKLSSGQRINSAKDDAAGLAISQSLTAQTASINQASRNSADAISSLQIAEGAMGEVANTLVRMRELSMQSASGQVSDGQRAFIHQEMDQLRQEVSRISEVTEFNGLSLLDGSLSGSGNTLSFQVGIQNTANDRIGVNIGTLSSTGLGINTMSFTSQTASQNALTKIDSAINSISVERANLGAKMNRLQITIDNLASANENLSAANSRIRDVDVGSEMGNMVSNQILAQAGSAMLSQANALPQIALSLIG